MKLKKDKKLRTNSIAKIHRKARKKYIQNNDDDIQKNTIEKRIKNKKRLKIFYRK